MTTPIQYHLLEVIERLEKQLDKANIKVGEIQAHIAALKRNDVK